MMCCWDYLIIPQGFNLALRVNFVDGGDESEGLVFTGSEGIIEIGWNQLTISRSPRETEPGHTIDTFTDAMQKRILVRVPAEVPASASIGSAGCRIMKSMWLRRAIPTATTTSRTFSRQSERDSLWWKTPCSGTVPQEQRYSAI